MINKNPKTYNEIIRMKKCYELTKYYTNVTENMFNEIYDFLGLSPMNTVIANQNVLSLVDEHSKIVKTYNMAPKNLSFDNIKVSNSGITVVPHYEPHSYSSYSSSSSNNNNNNNNNNKNNNNNNR